MADVSDECWNEWINNKAVANAGVVVVNSRSRALLLLKHTEWEIPSGGIEKNESPKMAAIRELNEETKIPLSEEDLIEMGVVTAFHPNGGKTDVIVTFVAFKDAEVFLSSEHVANQWLSLERSDDPTIPMHPTTRRQLSMARDLINQRHSV